MNKRLFHNTHLRGPSLAAIALLAGLFIVVGSSPAFGQAGDIGLYTDPTGTSCDFTDAGPIVEFHVIHKNAGGATGAQFRAQLPTAFTALGGVWVADQWEPAFLTIGDSQNGVAMAYTSCRSGDIYLGRIIALVPTPGATPPCTEYPILPDPNNTVIPGEVIIYDCQGQSQAMIAGARIATINNDGGCTCGSFVSGIEVTNTNDSGAGSLREAITEANLNAGLDRIHFNILGGGPHVITPLTSFPNINDPVIIDGYTQPGASANTNAGFSGGSDAVIQIELNGGGASMNGLNFVGGTGGSTVKGLAIANFDGLGIYLQGHNAVVEGCFVGLDASGAPAGNTGNGFVIQAVTDVTIGGTAAAARNIIADNGNEVFVSSSSTGVTIQGNFIGTNPAGTATFGGSSNAIGVAGGATATIGGSVSGAGNLISGEANGILIQSGSTGVTIEGNRIGTDVTGFVDLGHTNEGVYINGASGNTVGGTAVGAGNLISGNNGNGVRINGANNLVVGNLIGTDASGAAGLGNGGSGVLIFNSTGNEIGGTTSDHGNVIAFNTLDGVALVSGGNGNKILYNSIFSNGGLGIDLGDDGVTANDVDDVDTGENDLQNFPVLTSAVTGSGVTTVTGTLNSTPNTTFLVGFFHNASCDGSGNGEGGTPYNLPFVTTDGDGEATFSNVIGVPLPVGDFVTATATNWAIGNTSEFSMCTEVTVLYDLDIVTFYTDDFAVVQQDVTGINLRIRNDGLADITSPILVGLYHSTDDVITTDDLYVSRRTITGGLAAGAEMDVEFTTAKLPFETPLGAGFMGVIVDEFDDIPETDETDNTATSSLSIEQMPEVGQIKVYFDSLFTQPAADCPGTVLDTLYVAAEDLGVYISGIEYMVDYPSVMTFISDFDLPAVSIGTSDAGISLAWAIAPDVRIGKAELHRVLVQWTCDDCIQFDDPIEVVPHPVGYIQAVAWPSGDIVLASGGTSPICADSDGDGVLNGIDQCPLVNSAPYDVDGDGCIDLTADNRRIEYWTWPDFPIGYVINESGCPGITDGSEFTEVQDALNTWNAVAGSDAEYLYGGTVTQIDARVMDQVNLVTFNDPDFVFPPGVLAVGIATSFTEPTYFGGSLFREGQLLDFDMIYNASISFSTASAGSGPRILDVGVHEGGHGLGISHTIPLTSTMAYVLHPEAETLEADDSLTVFMHYGDPTEIAMASQLGGTITDGYTSNPIEAAIVFAIDAASGDTTGCALTRNDGSYIFVGLPAGDYYVACHPIDSTSTINYIRPGNINPLVASLPLVDFIPESWDFDESSSDDANDRDLVPLTAGVQVLDIDIITNVDETPPMVTTVFPADEATGVPIGSAILIKFSESINLGTTPGNIVLVDTTAHDSLSLGGFASQDDSLLTILPGGNLSFQTVYQLIVKTGITDKFSNPLASEFVSHFETELQPDVFISSLEPTSGAVGAVVTIDGAGFETDMGQNVVTFGGVVAPQTSATATELIVTVPEGATSGLVQVENQAQASQSNELPFSVLTPKSTTKGSDAGSSDVGAVPRAVTLLPDASRAFVATTAGFSVVETDATLSTFLNSVEVLTTSGLDGIDATPMGNRVYAVSGVERKLYRINTDETPIDVDVEVAIPTGEPLGLLIEPGGQRAFVPTDLGQITIWDLNQANTVTFETQIGAIEADPNLRGPLASAAGQYLLALTGTGKLLVFDLAGDTLITDVSVGLDPRGVTANPQGDIAYVTDAGGTVDVVSLASFTKLATITTGGSLRQPVVTPDGTFLFCVNRELNIFSVIDIRSSSPTFHQVVTTPSLGVNPTAAEIGSGGLYAFVTSEEDQALNAVAIGVGPTLDTVVPLASPVGGRLVLAGSDLDEDETVEVDFDGVRVAPDVLTDSTIVVTVPPTAESGPLTVIGTNTVGPQMVSNAIFFTVLDATPDGAIRLSGGARPVDLPDLYGALAVSPRGDFVAIGGDSDSGDLYGVHFLDSDPMSVTFNQFFGAATTDVIGSPEDVVVTPDGKRTFALSAGDVVVGVFNSDRFSSGFGNLVGTVDFSLFDGPALSRLAMHPDGRRLLVSDPGLASVHIVDIELGSPQLYVIVGTIGLAGAEGTNGDVNEMAFHPAGRYLYLAVEDESVTEGVLVVDMATETVVGSAVVAGTAPFEAPLSMSFAPDGDVCIVLTSQIIGVTNRTLRAFDTSDPANPVALDAIGIVGGGSPTYEHVHVSPVGDRAVVNVRDSGFYYFDISDPTDLSLIEIGGDVFHHLAQVDFGYTPDALSVYSVSAFRDSAFVQDFAQPQSLALDSGDGQSGIAGNALPLPIRVMATNVGPGTPAAGVAVTFNVTAGGGVFAGTGTATQTVVTDVNGIASVNWTLGAAIGTGLHQATATAMGLAGSPVAFTADAEADPETLPLVVLTVAPPDAEPNVAITTNIQTTFRRAVDPATITIASETFTLRDGSSVVPVTYGFADANRKVSMTPAVPLDFGKIYTIEMTDGIKDASGGALENVSGPLTAPITTTFTTQAPPPLVVNSVDPPSGLAGIPIVISGVGMNPDATQNTVMFNLNIPAVITASGNDFINVNVPLGSISGPIAVQVAGGGAPDTIGFIVLEPAEEGAEEVIANVGTGNQPTRSIGMTPDGTRAYATGENAVVKIDIQNLSSGAAIPVGIDPVSIVISPDGKYAYVANNGSGTVSIIGTDPTAPPDTFETTIDNVNVGTSPLDLAIHPDGDILYVANAGSNDVSIVDTDENSQTFNAVIGNFSPGTAGAPRSLSITPDGTRLFVGSDGDIQIISTLDNAVIGNVGTGNTGTRSLSITPDGAKLVALTLGGQIAVYDIVPGSPTSNQVIGVFGGGGTQQTRSLSITPDGTQIWAVQEISDQILVLSLSFTGGISVIDVPETATELTVVAVIDAGEDPAFVVFDPTGSGIVLVSNPGDKTVTVLSPDAGPIPAVVHVEPSAVTIWNPNPGDTLAGQGLSMKSTGFRYIEATIELPTEPKAYYAQDINIATVRLIGEDENGSEVPGIYALEGEKEILDKDENGIDELHVKFDRVDLQYSVPQGEDVPLVIVGNVDGRTFVGRDTVETLAPRVVSPSAGASLAAGQTIDIRWESPPGVLADVVDVFWSPNDGVDWYPIAGKVPDTGSVPWMIPQGHYTECRVIVILYKNEREIGAGLSQETFTIGGPPAVALAVVQITNAKRAARIHWTTAAENGIGGFHILRSQQEDSGYERITNGIVPARGKGTVYQFDDGDVHLNETYYYKLEGISREQAGATFGPYKFVYAAKFALQQNAPNPFNPTTIIRFTVPEDSPVKLVVYDVAGRHVRTLVNGRRRADHYDVTWDGKDANGRGVASGVYFYRIQVGRHTATKKMVMLK